ncbi:uncharacterized protein LOC111345772 [Stylophora pistillata]|uniref:uncharacterized protein LOC111345772 n=1 Tax=Stylophora pistillata TaxID=50429 RepID=UPI000C03E17E|nr:uncharacterized protein LOC111345772 [Stylophora pistillata]
MGRGLEVNRFKICLREAKIFDGPHKNLKLNWIAFNNINVHNFTMINSLLFSSTNSPSPQSNYALCQHTSKTKARICVKTFNSDSNNKDVIIADVDWRLGPLC